MSEVSRPVSKRYSQQVDIQIHLGIFENGERLIVGENIFVMLLVEHFTVDRSERLRTNVRVRILKDARTSIASLGAGTKVPQFNQNTRQRRK